MRQGISLLLLAALVTLMSVMTAAQAKATTPVEFVEAMNARYRAADLEGILANVADDAVFVVPEGSPWRGKAEIAGNLERFFSAYKITGVNASGYSTQQFGDLAVVTYTYSTEMEHAGKRLIFPGKETYILRRHGDSWIVVHDQLTATQTQGN